MRYIQISLRCLDGFLLLLLIPHDESRRVLNQRMMEPVGGLNLTMLCIAEIFLKVIDERHITACKTEDRLPVVTHAVEFGLG